MKRVAHATGHDDMSADASDDDLLPAIEETPSFEVLFGCNVGHGVEPVLS